MFECLVAGKTLFWVLTGLFIISEILGETKAVKSNGILAFIFELIEQAARIIRKILFHR